MAAKNTRLNIDLKSIDMVDHVSKRAKKTGLGKSGYIKHLISNDMKREEGK